jgi:hypothetical protein
VNSSARDLAELCGPHFYHANVVLNLRQNRVGAAEYLRGMSRRHGPRVSDALLAAAEEYDTVVATLEQVNAGREAVDTAEGRSQFISRIRETMDRESGAHERMTLAVRAMG